MRAARLFAFVAASGFALPAATSSSIAETDNKDTSCVACHTDPEWFDQKSIDSLSGEGVHHQADLSCHDCHGGNPDPALAGDFEGAMDRGYSSNPYRGVPERSEIPAFCGRCHSNPEFMRRYHPDPRVDQEREYWTSRHGIELKAGNAKVATCVDCHGAHGVLGPRDNASPIHPTRVADTCRHCHGDKEYMADATTSDGRPMPVDQHARWTRSVHATAMFEKEDLTAPTCNDCHGNHGATPPGLDSIAYVCGQCHGREAELFRASGKRDGFRRHNEYVEGLGSQPCADCHAPSEPQAALTGFHSFTECASCHGNHAVVRPTVAMLGVMPPVPCAFCHGTGGPLADSIAGLDSVPPEPGQVQAHYEEVRDTLLEMAAEDGLTGEGLFNWMVDRALELPVHRHGPDGGGALRPEFARLFEKFRIGKTYFTYSDPVSGEDVQESIRRCTDCHASEPTSAETAAGYETALEFLDSMQELTSLTARAERITLAAQRGGVLVEDAALAVDRAVDGQIQQEVLVHTFSVEQGGDYAEQHIEAIEHAETALTLAQSALDELEFRRRGLAISLVLIVLVLIGLAIKIRQLGTG